MKPLSDTHPTPQLRRVIGGVVYDTATASRLHHWQPDYDDNPFADVVGEVLHVTAFGAYFLLNYNEMVNDAPQICPLTWAAALAWAERRCPHLAEDLFGPLHEAGEGEPYTPKADPNAAR